MRASAGRQPVYLKVALTTREDLRSFTFGPKLASLLMGLLVASCDLLANLVEGGRRGRAPRTGFLNLLWHTAALLVAPLETSPQEECESRAPRPWKLLLTLYSDTRPITGPDRKSV